MADATFDINLQLASTADLNAFVNKLQNSVLNICSDTSITSVSEFQNRTREVWEWAGKNFTSDELKVVNELDTADRELPDLQQARIRLSQLLVAVLYKASQKEPVASREELVKKYDAELARREKDQPVLKDIDHTKAKMEARFIVRALSAGSAAAAAAVASDHTLTVFQTRDIATATAKALDDTPFITVSELADKLSSRLAIKKDMLTVSSQAAKTASTTEHTTTPEYLISAYSQDKIEEVFTSHLGIAPSQAKVLAGQLKENMRGLAASYSGPVAQAVELLKAQGVNIHDINIDQTLTDINTALRLGNTAIALDHVKDLVAQVETFTHQSAPADFKHALTAAIVPIQHPILSTANLADVVRFSRDRSLIDEVVSERVLTVIKTSASVSDDTARELTSGLISAARSAENNDAALTAVQTNVANFSPTLPPPSPYHQAAQNIQSYTQSQLGLDPDQAAKATHEIIGNLAINPDQAPQTPLATFARQQLPPSISLPPSVQAALSVSDEDGKFELAGSLLAEPITPMSFERAGPRATAAQAAYATALAIETITPPAIPAAIVVPQPVSEHATQILRLAVLEKPEPGVIEYLKSEVGFSANQAQEQAPIILAIARQKIDPDLAGRIIDQAFIRPIAIYTPAVPIDSPAPEILKIAALETQPEAKIQAVARHLEDTRGLTKSAARTQAEAMVPLITTLPADQAVAVLHTTYFVAPPPAPPAIAQVMAAYQDAKPTEKVSAVAEALQRVGLSPTPDSAKAAAQQIVTIAQAAAAGGADLPQRTAVLQTAVTAVSPPAPPPTRPSLAIDQVFSAYHSTKDSQRQLDVVAETLERVGLASPTAAKSQAQAVVTLLKSIPDTTQPSPLLQAYFTSPPPPLSERAREIIKSRGQDLPPKEAAFVSTITRQFTPITAAQIIDNSLVSTPQKATILPSTQEVFAAFASAKNKSPQEKLDVVSQTLERLGLATPQSAKSTAQQSFTLLQAATDNKMAIDNQLSALQILVNPSLPSIALSAVERATEGPAISPIHLRQELERVVSASLSPTQAKSPAIKTAVKDLEALTASGASESTLRLQITEKVLPLIQKATGQEAAATADALVNATTKSRYVPRDQAVEKVAESLKTHLPTLPENVAQEISQHLIDKKPTAKIQAILDRHDLSNLKPTDILPSNISEVVTQIGPVTPVPTSSQAKSSAVIFRQKIAAALPSDLRDQPQFTSHLDNLQVLVEKGATPTQIGRHLAKLVTDLESTSGPQSTSQFSANLLSQAAATSTSSLRHQELIHLIRPTLTHIENLGVTNSLTPTATTATKDFVTAHILTQTQITHESLAKFLASQGVAEFKAKDFADNATEYIKSHPLPPSPLLTRISSTLSAHPNVLQFNERQLDSAIRATLSSPASSIEVATEAASIALLRAHTALPHDLINSLSGSLATFRSTHPDATTHDLATKVQEEISRLEGSSGLKGLVKIIPPNFAQTISEVPASAPAFSAALSATIKTTPGLIPTQVTSVTQTLSGLLLTHKSATPDQIRAALSTVPNLDIATIDSLTHSLPHIVAAAPPVPTPLTRYALIVSAAQGKTPVQTQQFVGQLSLPAEVLSVVEGVKAGPTNLTQFITPLLTSSGLSTAGQASLLTQLQSSSRQSYEAILSRLSLSTPDLSPDLAPSLAATTWMYHNQPKIFADFTIKISQIDYSKVPPHSPELKNQIQAQINTLLGSFPSKSSEHVFLQAANPYLPTALAADPHTALPELAKFLQFNTEVKYSNYSTTHLVDHFSPLIPHLATTNTSIKNLYESSFILTGNSDFAQQITFYRLIKPQATSSEIEEYLNLKADALRLSISPQHLRDHVNFLVNYSPTAIPEDQLRQALANQFTKTGLTPTQAKSLADQFIASGLHKQLYGLAGHITEADAQALAAAGRRLDLTAARAEAFKSLASQYGFSFLIKPTDSQYRTLIKGLDQIDFNYLYTLTGRALGPQYTAPNIQYLVNIRTGRLDTWDFNPFMRHVMSYPTTRLQGLGQRALGRFGQSLSQSKAGKLLGDKFSKFAGKIPTGKNLKENIKDTFRKAGEEVGKKVTQALSNLLPPGIGQAVGAIAGFIVGKVAGAVAAFFGGTLYAAGEDSGKLAVAGANALAGLGSSVPSAAAGAFAALVEIVTATAIGIGTTFAIILLSIPIVLALILHIINTSSYLVPPSYLAYNPIGGAGAGGFENRSGCPILDGYILVTSYNPNGQTGHGSNSYWGTADRCDNYSLPQGTGCKAPTDPGNPTSFCYLNTALTKCDIYGYANDIFSRSGSTSVDVFFPLINGQEAFWTYVRGSYFDNPPSGALQGTNGHSYAFSTTLNGQSYYLLFTHINYINLTYSPYPNPESIVNVKSGLKFATLYNQGNNTHLHLEVRIDGEYVKPEEYFCNV